MAQQLHCKQFTEKMTDYLEDALPPEERELFEAHEVSCSACQLFVRQVRETIDLVAAGDPSEATVPERVRAAFFRGGRGPDEEPRS